MRKITEIIIHCTATPAGRPVSVAEINLWHRQRGFRSIGYHYLIALDGTVLEGRPVDEIGAHCLGHNANSIGIAYVGGILADGSMQPADTRTETQKTAMRNLLVRLRTSYPEATIHSHRDFAAKACPSFDATAEYADI